MKILTFKSLKCSDYLNNIRFMMDHNISKAKNMISHLIINIRKQQGKYFMWIDIDDLPDNEKI